jgi:hypothetical protein
MYSCALQWHVFLEISMNNGDIKKESHLEGIVSLDSFTQLMENINYLPYKLLNFGLYRHRVEEYLITSYISIKCEKSLGETTGIC